VSYQYDGLKQLTSAASTPNTGCTPAAWTQTYHYDGFGNLTAKVLNGATTPIGIDAATNRLSGTTAYDANENLIAAGVTGMTGGTGSRGRARGRGIRFFTILPITGYFRVRGEIPVIRGC
jgi:hypothetical protein